MDEVERPGYVTTEFWMTLGTQVLAAVTAVLGLLTPGFELDPDVQQLVVALAPIASAIGAAVYAISRSRVKAATLGLRAARLEIAANTEHIAALTAEVQARTENTKVHTLAALGTSGSAARKQFAEKLTTAE
jgi:hypothetical protein